MRAILPALGIDAFETAGSKPTVATAAPTIRYYLSSCGGKGEAEERSDGFLVFAGAIARRDETPSLKSSTQNRVRQRLIASGRLADDGSVYRLTEDTLFRTPSAAAVVLVGGHVNGRTEWRDTDGVTLKDHQIASAGRPG